MEEKHQDKQQLRRDIHPLPDRTRAALQQVHDVDELVIGLTTVTNMSSAQPPMQT